MTSQQGIVNTTNSKTSKELKMNGESRKTWKAFGLAVMVVTIAFQSSAATHYVSQTSPNPTSPYSTPDTAAHTIQEAVDVAIDGDTVLVQPGDYGLTNQVTVTNGILLQGANGASQTFLTALTNHIWCLRVTNSLAVVDGLSLRNQYDPYGGVSGGAVLAGGTIQNCTFSNFYVGKPGGAIVASAGTVSNSIVTYRRYGGGIGAMAVDGDRALITDCLILGIPSPASGGGVSLTNSRLQNSVISGVLDSGLTPPGVALSALTSSIVNCTISNNFNLGQGSGAYLQDSFMDRCIVTHNEGGGECLGNGGGGIFETNSVIRNSLITSNSVIIGSADPSCGSYGGGVYMQGGSLENCTVVGNSAQVLVNGSGGGGGVFAERGDIYDSIIYFNSAFYGSSNWLNTGGITFYNSCSAPYPVGAGNITDDPRFVDVTNGNYHLSGLSPCIAFGQIQPWMADAQDLDGNPRTTNGRVDLGAYQSGYLPLTSRLSIFRSGTNIVVQWVSGEPYNLVLESSSDLTAPGGWTPVQTPTYTNGTNDFVTLSATNHVQFFRRR
jgi:hypothetical protein